MRKPTGPPLRHARESGNPRIGRISGVVLATVLLLAATAGAHPLAPALLELTQVEHQRVDVRWKTSRWRPTGATIEPVLPGGCTPVGARTTAGDATGITERWTLECDAPLVGAVIGVDGLDASNTNAIARVRLGDGRVLQTVLSADAPRYTIPERTALRAVVIGYADLGVEHILGGFDHLLFVFGLLLLARGWRRLLATVTAFTLGHSVTLALATLGYATLPSAPIELLIALTILYLAVELAADGDRDSWARRRPWRMAAGFGWLHGLGFAGALREVGLPEGDIPLALLSFNLGIEAGQLAFVAVVVGASWLARPALLRLPAAGARVPVYVMGSLAAYWCCERAATLWG